MDLSPSWSSTQTGKGGYPPQAKWGEPLGASKEQSESSWEQMVHVAWLLPDKTQDESLV